MDGWLHRRTKAESQRCTFQDIPAPFIRESNFRQAAEKDFVSNDGREAMKLGIY